MRHATKWRRRRRTRVRPTRSHPSAFDNLASAPFARRTSRQPLRSATKAWQTFPQATSIVDDALDLQKKRLDFLSRSHAASSGCLKVPRARNSAAGERHDDREIWLKFGGDRSGSRIAKLSARLPSFWSRARCVRSRERSASSLPLSL
jgi:hypothetical protein